MLFLFVSNFDTNSKRYLPLVECSHSDYFLLHSTKKTFTASNGASPNRLILGIQIYRTIIIGLGYCIKRCACLVNTKKAHLFIFHYFTYNSAFCTIFTPAASISARAFVPSVGCKLTALQASAIK